MLMLARVGVAQAVWERRLRRLLGLLLPGLQHRVKCFFGEKCLQDLNYITTKQSPNT